MTTTQATQTTQNTQNTQATPSRSWLTRWVTAAFRAYWHAHAEMAAASGGYFLVY
jgi:hypothetical protein